MTTIVPSGAQAQAEHELERLETAVNEANDSPTLISFRKRVEEILEGLNLNTVCREANCPNIAECFSRSTATFMILGTNCTRSCRFCNVISGSPQPPDPQEPENIAQAVVALGLKYAVITSVTRDDLPDGGAGHFAKVINAVKRAAPGTIIEVLIPDFAGDTAALKTVTDAAPCVISHNMETVRPLYAQVRAQAEYQRSLDLIAKVKQLNPGISTKSGFMLGLGETEDDVDNLLKDLFGVGCEMLTIGQYLAPTGMHAPVREYVSPARFDALGQRAREIGFKFVASAPLVRSSYRAGEVFGVGATDFGFDTVGKSGHCLLWPTTSATTLPSAKCSASLVPASSFELVTACPVSSLTSAKPRLNAA